MDFLSTHSFLDPGQAWSTTMYTEGNKTLETHTLESAMGRKDRSIKQDSGQIYDRAIDGNTGKLSHISLEADGSEE